MALFKRAYAHGSMKALIDTKAVKIANEELAAALADEGSESLPEEPVGEVAPEATADLAANLVELADSLQASADSAAAAAETVVGGDAGAPPGGMPAEMPAEMKGAPPTEEAKEASAKRAAIRFVQKLAQGSTITGDRPDQQNTPALGTTGEGAMDQQQRPEGFANVGVAGVGQQEAAGKGKIGDEEKVEGIAMGPVAVDGSNTVTEVVNKSASIQNLIRAAARIKQSSTTVGVGAVPADAATGELALDDKNRPGGSAYANKGVADVGKTDEVVPAKARIGDEKAHPGQEAHAGGTNTVIQETKVGEDEAYMQRFKTLGAKYANRFPFYFADHQKVAAVQYLMGLPPQECENVVTKMEKTAEMPAGLKNYIASKGDSEGKSDAEKKDEEDKKDKEDKEDKKDETDKKASAPLPNSNLLSRLRRMQA